MFKPIRVIAKKAAEVFAEATKVIRRVVTRLWSAHGSATRTNPAYRTALAATAAVIVGCLPWCEAVMALTALVLGVEVRGAQSWRGQLHPAQTLDGYPEDHRC